MTKRISLLLALIVFLGLFLAGWHGRTKRSAAAPASLLNYLPALFTPPVDFTITGLEVSQAIQKPDNSVPLVTGKDTVVRVFAQTVVGVSPGNVTISLSATRGATPLGTLTDGPKSVPATPGRGSYGSTSNFRLPASWLSGNVDLVATVDSAGVVAESNEANNSFQASLAFNVVPDLDVMIVPIDYTHLGSTNPGFYPGQRVDNISDWIERTYPVGDVSVSFRSVDYAFAGNLDLRSEWDLLLNEIKSLKSTDFPPSPSSQIYFALVPIHNGSSQWFFQGIAGIGFVCCTRVSVGLNLGANDSSGILAAHEIGHNLRRSHAPCGVSPADPNYPYAGASIGEYGLDIQGSGVTLRDPATYVDMMSYCNPDWLSDYTYLGLYADQLIRGLVTSSAPIPALMIRASFADDGTPAIDPIYAFPQVITQEAADPDYVVELLDEGGAVIASQGTRLFIAEEPGITVRAIHVVMPLPKQPVAAVRLLQSGVILAQRPMRQLGSTPAPNLAVARSPQGAKLTWNATGVPAIIRYSADNGQSWTTLALDVVGGELTLDVDELPAGNGRFQVILADSADAANLNHLSVPFVSD